MSIKDIIVYSAIGLFGIIMIYVLFGTNIIISNNENVPIVDTKSNFNNFNMETPRKDATDTDNKIDLVNEEMAAERELQEMEKRKTQGQVEFKVNDVNSYMNSGGEQLQEERQEQMDILLPKKQPIITPQTSRPKIQKEEREEVKTSNVPITKEVNKRTRSSDPTFGDSTEEPIAVTFQAIVDGDQVINNGSRLLLRITETLDIQDCPVIANTLFTGNVTTDQSRVYITFLVPCGNSQVEMEVVDFTDKKVGLYVNKPANEVETGDVSRDVVQSGTEQIGLPVIGRAINGIANKKINTTNVSLKSGTRCLVRKKSGK